MKYILKKSNCSNVVFTADGHKYYTLVTDNLAKTTLNLELSNTKLPS